MIKYSLRCTGEGHEFEGWFPNSSGYDDQAQKGEISSPCCGSNKIEKAIMAPAIAKNSSGQDANPGPSELAFLRALRRKLEATAENVGDRFADTAVKIHNGEEPVRPIYGNTTAQEDIRLKELGIRFGKMNWPTLDDN